MISLLQLEWPLLLAVFCIILFAGLVHGTLGLGFPMVATPMLALFFDVRAAILITLLPTAAVNIASIYHSNNSLQHVRTHAVMVFFVFLGSVLGAYWLAVVDPSPFRLILAGLILLYLWISFTNRVPKTIIANHIVAAMVVVGFLSGLSGGTTNVMVAILIIFFLALELPRNTMVPVLNSCFLIGKLSQIAVLSVAGFVSVALLLETAPLALGAVCALLLGQRVRENIPVGTYRRILYMLLLVLAIVLLIQFFASVTLRN